MVFHRAQALDSGPRAPADELALMLGALGGGRRPIGEVDWGREVWREDRIAAGQLFVHPTCERQTRPVEDSDGLLLWQGRLDNRRDLCEALDLPGDSPTGPILLAAYHRWREQFLDHLLGPMAVVLWDRPQRRLLLARDPLGGRALFFHASADRLLVASEEVALLLHPEVEAHPDPDRLEQLFALTEPRGSSTFFRGIRQIEAGEVRAFTSHGPADGQTIHRFWPFDPAPPLLGGSADDRAEEYLHALGEAVRCRVGSSSRTAVSLSGGLDSTAIAALAADQLTSPLLGATWAFERHPGCDERGFLRELAEGAGIQQVPIPCDDAGPPSGLGDLSSWLLHPSTPEQNPYRRFHQRTYRAVAQRGAGVLLSGMLGDQLWSGGERWLWEQLRGGRPRAALAGLAARLRPEPGVALSHHLRRSIRPITRALLPPPMAARWRPPSPPPWAVQQVAPSTALGSEFHRSRRPTQYAALLSPEHGHGFGVERWFAARHGLEVRYPYRDRRVIELALRLPVEDLSGGQLTRPLHRRALRDHLPTSILERTGKTTFAPLFWESIKENRLDKLLERYGDASGPWLESGWLDRARQRRSPTDAVGLWLAISFGWWWETALSGIARAKRAPQLPLSDYSE